MSPDTIRRDIGTPDVTELLVAGVNETIQNMQITEAAPVGRPDVEIIQQRTILNHPRRRGDHVGSFGVTFGLSHLDFYQASSHERRIVGFAALQPEDNDEWHMLALTSVPMDVHSAQPLAAVKLLCPGVGISHGAVVSTPEIQAIRIDLPDGTYVEEAVTQGSVLAFAPFASSSSQDGEASIRVIGENGRVILTEHVDLREKRSPAS